MWLLQLLLYIRLFLCYFVIDDVDIVVVVVNLICLGSFLCLIQLHI